MPVTYLDPAGEARVEPQPYTLRLDISRRPLTLGLIANSFPDGTEFMDCLERSLLRELPGVATRRFQKPFVDPITDEVQAALKAECHAAVAVWGH